MQVSTVGGIDIVALLTSIGGIIAAISAIAHSLSMRPELIRHKAAIQSASDFLGDVGTHIIASKEEANQLAEVVYDSLPDQGKSIVNKQAIRLNELQKKLAEAQEQLGKVPGAISHL